MKNLFQMNSADGSFIPVSDVERFLDEIKKSDTTDYVVLTRKKWEEMLEQMEDEYLIALVKEREKAGIGNLIPFEAVLAKDGLTLDDLEAMEDIEFE
jgi:hypothetical protein